MTAILDHTGRPVVATQTKSSEWSRAFYRNLKARYDAAQTSDDNERHWANADLLDARSALVPEIRRKTRSRARYEAQENNSYAKGMVLTLANDLIGTGPRLQLMTSDAQANKRIEQSFFQWSQEIGLAEKLRTMRVAKAVDGEVFAALTTNEQSRHDIQLTIVPFEADFIDPPVGEYGEDSGIRLDAHGNATDYFVFDRHPGSTSHTLTHSTPTNRAMAYRVARFGVEGEWTSAQGIMHWFRCDRPGQIRGISELITALPLFAMLRRFTLATIAAAETAADFAAVMRTSSSANVDTDSLPEDEWFNAIPLEYRAMLTLPTGWDITQLRAEHPSTTYAMFKRELINEVARCLNMPYNVAAADSSSYNYASGRLDHQVYHRALSVERAHLECVCMRRIFNAWLDEASLVPGLLPTGEGPFGTWNYRWNWDGPEHVDPKKVADARNLNIRNGTTHPAREYAAMGLDIDTEDESAAQAYGVTVEELRRARFKAVFQTGGADVEKQAQVEGDEADAEGEI